MEKPADPDQWSEHDLAGDTEIKGVQSGIVATTNNRQVAANGS